MQTLPWRPQKLKLVSALTPRSGCAASRAEHAAASALQQPATICAAARQCSGHDHASTLCQTPGLTGCPHGDHY